MNALTNRPAYIDTDALCAEAEKAGVAWARAKSAADLLEETKKTVLARCMASRIEAKMATNRAETFALADPVYENFVRGMVAAGEARDVARVRYDILKTRIELLRTNASTERAAMSMR